MDYLRNHCWCSDSNWGGHYNCQIIVNISSYEDHDSEDYTNMTHQEVHFSQKDYERAQEIFTGEPHYNDAFYRSYATKTIRVFNQDVLDWLEKNVADSNGNKMWAVGSKDYQSIDGSGKSVFFNRRKDAMAFIKRFSQWKKPIYYTQYFTDVRKKLNLKTMKYEDR